MLGVAANGDVYVVDWQNYLIRKLSFPGPPAIAPGGIVNGASFAAAPAAVAGGSIVAVFGTNLAGGIAIAADVVWPMQLSGVSFEVNGAAVPLYSVSPGQLTAQLPYDLAVGQASAVVRTAAGVSTAVSFNVARSAPGIFQLGGGRAAALNQDGTINSVDAPESRGNVVVVFLTGQGSVEPPWFAGAPASLTTLSRGVLPVSAAVGGIEAAVQFLGLSPGLVGLAQANVVIPASVTPGGEVPVKITIGGQESNTTTIAVR